MTAHSFLGTWRPLLSGDLAERAIGAAVEIANDLYPFSQPEHRTRPESEFSLAEGRAGVSIFFAYLDQVLPGQGYGDRAIELLNEAISGLDSITSRPELFHGFVGLAWAVEHLRGRVLEYDDGDPGSEIAVVLQGLLQRHGWTSFDLVSGLVGLGVYALERRQRPRGTECLKYTIQQIATCARRKAGMATWWTPPMSVAKGAEPHFPEGHFNLGMAHGIPAVIALLAEAHLAGEEVKPLLTEAVTWIWAQRFIQDSRSIFPTYVTPSGDSASTRLGWCYGDTGIAIALLKAAYAAKEIDWKRKALFVAREASLRRDDAETGIADASICHGTAGLAQIFNRLYQTTGDPQFADSAIFWVERTLGFRKPGQGIGGFSVLNVDQRMEVGWRAEPGFLLGAAGIGLVLLSAATAIEPAWDRILLISLPPCTP